MVCVLMSETYHIILVDDEDEIRGRIASKIDDDSGFRVVGTAGNGFDALSILEEQHVDVVLSDIRMPFVDGIELARIIRRDHPHIKIAFITGYDEFHYAKEAITLKVDAYLMKPVTSDDIRSFLRSLKNLLDQERRQTREFMDMKDQISELLPLIADSYLISLMQQERLTERDIQKLQLYGLDVESPQFFFTCVSYIDAFTLDNLEFAETRKVQVNSLFKKVFADMSVKHTLMLADSIVFLVSPTARDGHQLDELFSVLGASVQQLLGVTMLIGISAAYDDFKSFPTSYVEAKRALSYASLYDYGTIVFFDELRHGTVKKSLFSITDYAGFDRLIQYGDEADIQSRIIEMKKRLSQDAAYLREYVLIDLSGLLMHLFKQANIDVEEVIDSDIYSALCVHQTYDEMLDFVQNLFVRIHDLDERKQLSNSERIAMDALQYIHDHYQDQNLSLELLSDTLNVSHSHLSTLFKKHTGTTFTRHLIRYRMERAKELLETTDLKIVDIAIQVGYSDVYYFSHSFKKVVGVSPREYRKHEMV